MSKDRVYTILFENCETVTIPESAVYSFTADDVTEGYQGSARNGVYSYKEAKRVQMAIELDYLKNPTVPNFMFQDESSSLEERLSSGDIVSIETPDDVDIHVPWKEDAPQSNYLNGTQKTEVVNAWLKPDKDGDYLSISFSYDKDKDKNEEEEETDEDPSSENASKMHSVKLQDGISVVSGGESKPLQDIIKDINLRIDSIEAKTDSNTTNTVYAYKLKSSSKDSLVRVINELENLTSALSEWVNNCD